MFQLQPRYIGVEVEKHSFRFAVAQKTRHGWSVSSLKEVSCADTMHSFYPQFKEGILISALNTRDVLMRSCEIPLKKRKDIFAALEFHVEPLLPYSLDRSIIQAQIAGQQENLSYLNVFAIRKDHLSQHLEMFKQQRFEPENVITRPHALALFSTLLPQGGSPLLLVHEGEEELSIVLAEKGEILAFRSIDIKKELPRIFTLSPSNSHAPSLDLHHQGSEAVLNQPGLKNEIQKTLLSFASTIKNKSYESIYLFSKNTELKTLLQDLSELPILFPSSTALNLTQDELVHFGLAIGTAIAHNSINFRQKEFSYPRVFKRVKKPLALFFTLSTLLTGVTCIGGEMFLHQKHQAIEDTYLALLKSEKIAPSSSNLQTPQDYLFSLQAIEKQVISRPETFPLLPQVPKVKEVLSWLTSLTRLQMKSTDTIVIESLHYQMVKRPDFSHKTECYRVRVDLEFSAKDPASARTFQEVLKNAESFIENNEEIQWLAVKGKYKTSFFLKDKTKYG